MENLSILYTYQDRDDEALKITQMVEAKRKHNHITFHLGK